MERHRKHNGKWTVKFSPKAQRQVALMLKADTKKTKKTWRETLEKLQKDPHTAGTPIISDYNAGVVRELKKFAGIAIKGLSVWDGQAFREGEDIDLLIGTKVIELFGATVYNKGKKTTAMGVRDAMRTVHTGLLLYSAGYENGRYLIVLSGESRQPYRLSSKGIIIRDAGQGEK